MKKIGITGNIASGKTAVENIIKNSGFNVIDADFICHNALDSDAIIIGQIREAFSNYDIIDNNAIDRRKLGNIVFENSNLKLGLENILHPYVKKEIDNFILNHSNDELIFVSVPLLYETGMESDFDKVILVIADENVRLKRLCERNNFTVEQAKLRINAQMPQNKKLALADFIIENNFDLETLELNTQKVIKNLL